MEGVVLVDDDNRRNSIVLMKHRRQVKQRGRKLHFTDLALCQVLIELPAVHIALVACPQFLMAPGLFCNDIPNGCVGLLPGIELHLLECQEITGYLP